jgi:hypothetical protein
MDLCPSPKLYMSKYGAVVESDTAKPRETCRSATSYPSLKTPDASLRVERSATNRQSYGTACEVT